MTLYAMWTYVTPDVYYVVTFNSNGGTVISPMMVKEGEKILAPLYIAKDGFIFEGWFADEELTILWDFDENVANDDMTLYAAWLSIITYRTISFNSNSGTNISPITVENGTKATAPTPPTKAGYIFGGWYANQSLTVAWNFNNVVTNSMTLYAKWLADDGTVYRTITFNSDGGTEVDPITVADGTKTTAPAPPTKDGYVFVGWYQDEALQTMFNFQTTDITADITLYAKWQEINCGQVTGGTATIIFAAILLCAAGLVLAKRKTKST